MEKRQKEHAPIQFFENAVYTTAQVADIIHRNPKTVRRMCKDGIITARCDRGGYMVTGWAIRAYLECRLVSDL
jgi:hypothetical protein